MLDPAVAFEGESFRRSLGAGGQRIGERLALEKLTVVHHDVAVVASRRALAGL